MWPSFCHKQLGKDSFYVPPLPELCPPPLSQHLQPMCQPCSFPSGHFRLLRTWHSVMLSCWLSNVLHLGSLAMTEAPNYCSSADNYILTCIHGVSSCQITLDFSCGYRTEWDFVSALPLIFSWVWDCIITCLYFPISKMEKIIFGLL